MDEHKRDLYGKKQMTVLVGTTLRRILDTILGRKFRRGCGLIPLAKHMDKWGIAECEEKRDYIIDTIISNTEMLKVAIANSTECQYAIGGDGLWPKAVLNAGAGWFLTQAISECYAKQAPKIRVRTVPPTSVRRNRNLRSSETNKIVYVKPDTAPCSIGIDWDSTGTKKSEIRHLTYHIFPAKNHDGWKWNIDQLSKRWELFNGKKIAAIVTDSSTESYETVVEFMQQRGLIFDHVIHMTNEKKKRETLTWVAMLELLNPESAGENEVVFSAHAKGVRHDNFTDTLRSWTDLMYQSCLDFWPIVERQLSDKIATGSFKRYGTFKNLGNNQWHYSGTFFWWRLADFGRRDWRGLDSTFYGTESWLGRHSKADETSVLFLTFVDDLYRSDYWEKTIWKHWEKWKLAAEDRLVEMGS